MPKDQHKFHSISNVWIVFREGDYQEWGLSDTIVLPFSLKLEIRSAK